MSATQQVDADRLRDEVLGATAQMERLVGNLLVVASLDARATTRPTLIDLDGLVLEEAARARSGGREEVSTSAVSAAPAYANADDVRRVVRNVLDNAVVHARSRVALTVDVVDDGDGDAARSWAQLLVADDGPGVSPEHRERIFERFYRADPARSRDGGSGLGLSIARALAERNGGHLDLVAADHGTTLCLRLPTSA